MRSKKRRMMLFGSALTVSVFALLAAASASAGNRWDYWDPRNSIPARVIDTQLGVIGLAATIAGDYRTAAVVDHISGRFAPPAPVVVQQVHYPAPIVEHYYHAPRPRRIVEHYYYSPPRPAVVHHVHKVGCGHRGYDRGYDRGHHRGHHRDRYDDDDYPRGRWGYRR